MKLKYPTKVFKINQPFGANYNTYYSEGGLKGHSGLDLHCSYGEEIIATCDGYIYSTLNALNPDLMKYRAVYQLVEGEGDMAYEISYGHAKDILVKKGQYVKTGDVLMTGGNTGNVATGGRKITREEKDNGSTAGTHLHFQVRPLYKTKEYKYKDNYPIFDGEGILQKDGYYYFTREYNNGYAGCIDPYPYFENVPITKYQFKTTMYFGSRGEEVKKLQKLLNLNADGIFGIKTMRAVMAFQKAHGLATDGIVGRKTREKLNQ